MSGKCAPARYPIRWCVLRRHRGCRRKWTLPSSACLGVNALRCWWCWGINDNCCGSSSIHANVNGADAGLEEAFAVFGGVPSELLFDQMKAVIIDDQREMGGKLLENLEFARFAAHWGFRIRACRPYRARTKGKVERPISHVHQGFF